MNQCQVYTFLFLHYLRMSRKSLKCFCTLRTFISIGKQGGQGQPCLPHSSGRNGGCPCWLQLPAHMLPHWGDCKPSHEALCVQIWLLKDCPCSICCVPLHWTYPSPDFQPEARQTGEVKCEGITYCLTRSPAKAAGGRVWSPTLVRKP